MLPADKPVKVGDLGIVRAAEQIFFSVEGREIAYQVINHIVSMHNAFVAAKNELMPGKK